MEHKKNQFKHFLINIEPTFFFFKMYLFFYKYCKREKDNIVKSNQQDRQIYQKLGGQGGFS